MSAGIKCPHCGKRNFTSEGDCVYCGQPLISAGPARGSGTPPPKPPTAPPPAPTRHTTSPGSSSGSTMPVPTGSSYPVPTGPSAPIPIPPLPPPRPVNWTYDEPAHLKKLGLPNVEGTVISITDLQISVPPNMLMAILKVALAIIMLPFRPVIVLSALIFGHKPQPEKETVYTIRLEKPDGLGAEARVEGEVTTALAIRGDYISVWGIEKGGAILARKIFNHTSGVETLLKR